jgi:hypothetical protein
VPRNRTRALVGGEAGLGGGLLLRPDLLLNGMPASHARSSMLLDTKLAEPTSKQRSGVLLRRSQSCATQTATAVAPRRAFERLGSKLLNRGPTRELG